MMYVMICGYAMIAVMIGIKMTRRQTTTIIMMLWIMMTMVLTVMSDDDYNHNDHHVDVDTNVFITKAWVKSAGDEAEYRISRSTNCRMR